MLSWLDSNEAGKEQAKQRRQLAYQGSILQEHNEAKVRRLLKQQQGQVYGAQAGGAVADPTAAAPWWWALRTLVKVGLRTRRLAGSAGSAG